MQEKRESPALLCLLAITLLVSAACTSTQTASQSSIQTVTSMPQAKLDLMSYIDSGRYAQDVAEIVKQAKDDLRRNLVGVERPAMVLDIDETLGSFGFPCLCSVSQVIAEVQART